jgi:hypothetical protein
VDKQLDTCFGNPRSTKGRIPTGWIAAPLAAAITLILLSGIVLGQPAEETDDPAANPITYGMESDFSSRYLWRGLVFSTAGVMQNYVWASWGKLTGSVWSNCDLASETEGPRWNEVDFALALTSSYRSLDMETSLQAYVYPDQPEVPNTIEASWDLSWTAYRVQPFVIYSLDIKAYSGASFGEVGLRSAWDLGETVCMETSAEAGWGSARFNEAYIGSSRQAVNLASAEVAITWNCWRGWYVRPHLLASRLLDDELRMMVDHPSYIQIGAAVGGEF